jgi:hypothetical protein
MTDILVVPQDVISPLTGKPVSPAQFVRDVQAPVAGTPQAAQVRDQLREQIREQVRKSLEENGVARAQASAQADIAAEKAGQTIRILDNGRTVIVGSDIVQAPPALPGVAVHPGEDWDSHPNDFPPEVANMAYAFFAMCALMVVGWPIARALGRRIERKSETPTINPASSEQLQRIEQAVEAMAIEVERISESQRFMARIQSGSTAERV